MPGCCSEYHNKLAIHHNQALRRPAKFRLGRVLSTQIITEFGVRLLHLRSRQLHDEGESQNRHRYSARRKARL